MTAGFDQSLESALYFGRVMHKRLRPFVHRFDYRVFSLWLDIDAVGTLSQRLSLFSHNRWNVFSFFDKDHGARDGQPLRPHVESVLAEAGIDIDGGPINLLCFPRVLGYVFNPLSIYFCRHSDGSLRAILYEVSNTFGDRHSYLLPVDPARPADEPISQACDKVLYVSPFIGMTSSYRFRVKAPDHRLSILIRQSVPEGEQLLATLTGRRAPLRDRQLARAFVTHPLMTLKVDGLRTLAEQKRYKARGVSKTLRSKHLRQRDGHGHAVDLVPYINGKLRWEWEPIYEIAAAMHLAAKELGVRLRWGGVWDLVFNDMNAATARTAKIAVNAYVGRRREAGRRAFIDGPHFELHRSHFKR